MIDLFQIYGKNSNKSKLHSHINQEQIKLWNISECLFHSRPCLNKKNIYNYNFTCSFVLV